MVLRNPSPAMAFERIISEVQLGRQLFSTAGRSFGCGDVGVQEGDMICIFDGAVTPHVLRKANGDCDGTYTLVAAAYIHGVMNGEIERLGLEAKDIILIQVICETTFVIGNGHLDGLVECEGMTKPRYLSSENFLTKWCTFIPPDR